MLNLLGLTERYFLDLFLNVEFNFLMEKGKLYIFTSGWWGKMMIALDVKNPVRFSSHN
jgi:hypothetical protein